MIALSELYNRPIEVYEYSIGKQGALERHASMVVHSFRADQYRSWHVQDRQRADPFELSLRGALQFDCRSVEAHCRPRPGLA